MTASQPADSRIKLGQAIRLRVLDSALPPKPADKDGRPVSWVLVLSTPGLWYTFKGEDQPTWIPIDSEWIAHQVAEYSRYTEGGYTSPLLREHRFEGDRCGDVLQLAAWTDPADGKRKLIAAVAWALEDVEAQIARGQLKYLSVGIHGVTDEQGRTFNQIVAELSIVAAPHQLSIDSGRGTHILAGQSAAYLPPSTPPTDGAHPMTEEQMAALMAALEKKLMAAMDSKLAAMQHDDDDKDDDDTPPAAPGPMSQQTPSPDIKVPETPEVLTSSVELAQALERIETLERERNRAIFDRNYPTGAVVVLSGELRDACFELSVAKPKVFHKLAKAAKDPAEIKLGQKPADPAVPASTEIQWGVRLGAQSSASEPGAKPKAMTFSQIYEEAVKANPEDLGKAWADAKVKADKLGVAIL